MIIGSDIIRKEKLTSTNTFMLELLKDHDMPEGTVVTAGYQSGGRGQAGNKWESEAGMNLLFSVLMRPSRISPGEQFLISMVISSGICDFAERFVPVAKIKWPNDIYVENDKIAGILIENSIINNSIGYSVAGTGFNINQDKFISDAPNPISLKMITGCEYDIPDCLLKALSDLDRHYKQLLAGSYREIHDLYTQRLYRFNEWHSFSDRQGTFTGRIVSVYPDGLLRVEKRNGKLNSYAFKEIEFIL